ncbi:interleukin-21 receptor-like [Thalassophryne amazonica]|uniref:interleukin-21 receptor-like n=1 Tax=Thalassophryne amazonica TaxID=390379 RepID=UPI0014719204|nr:interleukin-21 receptor-like [Thalassophryne amazonica]
MKCEQLLLVCCCCCCSSILRVTNSINVKIESYSCVTDYWSTISCILKITRNPVEQTKKRYWIKFKAVDSWKPGQNYSCPLDEINQTYNCSVKANSDSVAFLDEDVYSVQLCLESDCISVTENFMPSLSIQPTTPYDVVVQRTQKNLKFTWETGYENHVYLHDELDYQLSVQTSQTNKTFDQVTSPFILTPNQLLELKLSGTCCVKVRSFPSLTSDYEGTWSKWSFPTCWKTEATEERKPILVILIKSLSPLCVVVGAVLFVFYSPTARLKIKSLSHTPSPAPFFGSLFKQYDGNLQEWLSPRHSVVMKNNAEEILSAASMIVESKTIRKELEENEDLQKLSVTQLLFSQCQTSICSHGLSPGDTPYTQLPCSTWGFGVEEVADTSASSTHFQDNSFDEMRASLGKTSNSPLNLS